MYIFTYIYIYIFTHIHIYIYTYLNIHTYITIQYNTIQIKYNTIQYNTIQYNTIYNTIQYTIQYNTIYNTIQCNAIQCNAIQCNAIQYKTIQYNTYITYIDTYIYTKVCTYFLLYTYDTPSAWFHQTREVVGPVAAAMRSGKRKFTTLESLDPREGVWECYDLQALEGAGYQCLNSQCGRVIWGFSFPRY